MRIRSIKPEFWRSRDIVALPIEDRLLFVGLWSYVDDNGVGRDEAPLIAADLFPHDMARHPRETLARITEGLQRLSEAGLIVQYDVDDSPYVEITNWKKHQRIDKPNKPRFPTSDHESAHPRDTLATPSRDTRDTPAPGTEEQGNRGTGEQGSSAPTERAANAAAPGTAQTIISLWIDACGDQRPPTRLIGQLSKEVKALLDEQQPYGDVLAAVQAWHVKGISPTNLPSVLHEIRHKRTHTTPADRRTEALTRLTQHTPWTPPTPSIPTTWATEGVNQLER